MLLGLMNRLVSTVCTIKVVTGCGGAVDKRIPCEDRAVPDTLAHLYKARPNVVRAGLKLIRNTAGTWLARRRLRRCRSDRT